MTKEKEALKQRMDETLSSLIYYAIPVLHSYNCVSVKENKCEEAIYWLNHLKDNLDKKSYYEVGHLIAEAAYNMHLLYKAMIERDKGDEVH